MRQIELGVIKVPQFQRDFVWSRTKSAKLIDSLLRGFPIGTFILWKTKEGLRTVRNIGDIDFPPTQAGDYTQYVLDGQQRLTSIFAILHGAKLNRDGKEDDFSQLYIDLDTDGTRDLVIADVSGMEPHRYVPIHVLLGEGMIKKIKEYPEEYHDRMLHYRQSIQSYSASIVEVQEASIDIATEIFTRINVSGVPLTVFEIMVAKTFDAERDFDLSKKAEDVLVKLDDKGYGTVREIVILQAVSAIMVKETRKRNILDLDKQAFIDIWPAAETGILRAVDYLKSTLGVPVSELLPYQSILVPLAYFFANNKRATPSGAKHERLLDYFWRTSLAGHYSQSLDTRLAQDIRRIDDILAGKQPSYDYPVDPSPDLVAQNGEFKTNRAFVKGILCLLAGIGPRRFDNHETRINVSNDGLIRANSRNYHHFFPKKHLEDDWQASYVNHVVNITIVDAELNKARIRAKAPSEYMVEFASENEKISATMKTHLIDIKNDGIWNKKFGGSGSSKDDYERFFERRCARISAELKKRIIVRPMDARGQSPNTEDLESSEIPE